MLTESSQKVALVTGGAKRVGRAIVERLLSEGWDVAFTYLHSITGAKELVASVDSNAPNLCLPIQVDLTGPHVELNYACDQFIESFDRLDLLVHSASIYLPDPEPIDSEFVRKLFQIHYQTPLYLAKSLLPHLRKSCGRIVHMTDVLAERPWPKYRTYCASKAALSNLTMSLAREFAPEVTVNGIAPGVVEWPADFPQSEREKYLTRVPLARAGTPQDVANLVHFLSTEGSYITGQIIRLDGGRSLI